ncbi:hypothetical protein M422DRAFT_255021 [Sphaerobolus stellatus SS14]|uniref:Uncharacterized protein n=1 Tax=Sphaerobolus stellatus (strain SS14) TaxID=990650 RepID=A0A0C9VTY3_SPHS4|nr:hypothetical protein M422DRAFT_255021 [Sphaerobolus stellatus SS14]
MFTPEIPDSPFRTMIENDQSARLPFMSRLASLAWYPSPIPPLLPALASRLPILLLASTLPVSSPLSPFPLSIHKFIHSPRCVQPSSIIQKPSQSRQHHTNTTPWPQQLTTYEWHHTPVPLYWISTYSRCYKFLPVRRYLPMNTPISPPTIQHSPSPSYTSYRPAAHTTNINTPLSPCSASASTHRANTTSRIPYPTLATTLSPFSTQLRQRLPAPNPESTSSLSMYVALLPSRPSLAISSLDFQVFFSTNGPPAPTIDDLAAILLTHRQTRFFTDRPFDILAGREADNYIIM